MIKVMLVDDEPSVIEGLKFIYDWNAEGFEIVACAYDGDDAIAKYHVYQPDLVISDIHMPKMDGLELCKYLLAQNAETKVAILSGYSEFSYARKAMSLGIEEYILKPIDVNELEAALERLSKAIWASRLEKLELESLRRQTNLLLPKAKEMLLQNLYEHPSRIFQSLNLLAEYQFGIEDGRFAILRIILDKPMLIEADKQENSRFLKDAIEHVLKSKTYERFEYRNNWVVLLQWPQPTRDFNQFVDKLLVQLNEMTADVLNSTISICSSTICNGYSEFVKAVQECNIVYENIFRQNLARQKLIYSEASIAASPLKKADIYRILDNISVAIRLGNIQTTTEQIHQLFSELRNLDGLSLDYYYSISYSIIGELFAQIHCETCQISYDDLSQCTTLEALENLTVDLAQKSLADGPQQGDPSITNSLAAAIEYMHQNYDKNLTLANVSQKIYLSPNYLCNLFKKELNVTFNNYLTKIRLEKAKEMLKTTQLTTQTIASKIGYSDYTYFSQLFKKNVGCTPSEFKKKLQSFDF